MKTITNWLLAKDRHPIERGIESMNRILLTICAVLIITAVTLI